MILRVWWQDAVALFAFAPSSHCCLYSQHRLVISLFSLQHCIVTSFRLFSTCTIYDLQLHPCNIAPLLTDAYVSLLSDSSLLAKAMMCNSPLQDNFSPCQCGRVPFPVLLSLQMQQCICNNLPCNIVTVFFCNAYHSSLPAMRPHLQHALSRIALQAQRP